MKWDASLYDDKHAFVASYGRALLALVNRETGQKILDLGCGTGALTGALAEQGATVVGADFSDEMLCHARKRWPDLTFIQGDAASLPFQQEFDTVFSNAVFHWIPDQHGLLRHCWEMLKPGGSLVFELGARGCGASVEQAFARQAQRIGYQFESGFFFPDTKTYNSLLRQAGFATAELWEFDRPTPLEGGSTGLRNWVRQFYASQLEGMGGKAAQQTLDALEKELYPTLWDGVQWVMDYRRLRGKAVK